MCRRSLLLCFGLFLATAANGQIAVEPLQRGKTVEKALAAGQVDPYVLNIEKDQFVQIAVVQRGIDVVIRVFAPGGKLLKEFDGPTGAEGTDYAEIISDITGSFRIEITSLDTAEATASGRYQIKILESRKATEEELQRRGNESTRKAKGLALAIETADAFDQFRVPETRVAMRIMAAEMLWTSDEKRASKLMAEAIETVKELIAANEDIEDDYARYQYTLQLRQQVLSALAPHDPEAALKFLQSTKPSAIQGNQELQLESALIDRVATTDPKRAFELAEDLLQRDCSMTLIQTLQQLMKRDRDLAGRLARDMAKKLKTKEFLKEPDAAYVGLNLIQMVGNATPAVNNAGAASKSEPLLAEQETRDLFLKIVSDFLSFEKSTQPEGQLPYGVAQGLVYLLGQRQEEINAYAPELADKIKKKLAELGGENMQPGMDWQRFQNAAIKEPVDTALESVEQAPPAMRDYLYQQVLNRMAASGDLSRARQLASERITSPSQRKQLLRTLQRQEITNAAQEGRLDEALQGISKFALAERFELLNQIIAEVGPGLKKSEAVAYLERARNLTSSSGRAEDILQMHTLLAIARAYARYDVNRAFQILGPLIDQFNEICAAAVVMNGFGGQYYVDGEMTTGRINELSGLGDAISNTLATLSRSNFDWARRSADGISRFDARARALLTIAADALDVHLDLEQYGADRPE